MGGAPARAPGGFVFEEQVGVGVHNARVSEKYRCFGVNKLVCTAKIQTVKWV